MLDYWRLIKDAVHTIGLERWTHLTLIPLISKYNSEIEDALDTTLKLIIPLGPTQQPIINAMHISPMQTCHFNKASRSMTSL